MKNYNITALGEILIDYTPMQKSPAGMQVFEQNPGGAPANMLACATKFGHKTAFIGKVGQDMQGDFLKHTLKEAGIEAKGVVSDPNYFTTLAFVSLSDTGERSFAFARKPGADTMLTIEEVDTTILDETQIFHFGSLSLTHQKSHDATIFAVEYAKDKGAIISYDPNFRELLWDSKEAAILKMKSVLKYVDILKVSDEEAILLTGEEDLNLAANKLVKMQIPVVAITLGADGALIANRDGVSHIDSYKTEEIIDTTGAGDSFWGAVLYKLAESGKKPSELTLSQLSEFVKFANATASLCVRKRGGIPAMPKLQEVLKLYNE